MTGWPVEPASEVRELVSWRDRPAGAGVPWCVVCGEPITGRVVHLHHRRYRSAGGDGRPSNLIAVHGEGQGDGCHATAIHAGGGEWACTECGWKTPKWAGRCGSCRQWGTVESEHPPATAQGWVISRHTPAPGCYRTPLLCAWRGWIVLTDDGKWHKASAAEMAGAR